MSSLHRKLEKKFVEVTVGESTRRMAYVEMGEGDPILFQHGNPTSSYLWRNIMPHVADLGRCIAVDLIGMGDSDKLDNSGPDRYRFVEHRDYLHAAWQALGVANNVTLVIHDWGSALGFDWARQNPEQVKGICYMEAIVAPMTSWEQFPEAPRGVFQGFRSPAGEEMVLEKNVFVEQVLPGSILRDLADEEMAVYRAPFAEPGEGRRPTLTWPRQIPIEGEPADVTEIANAYCEWLKSSEVPKLFVNAEPGALITGAMRELARSFPNQTEVTVAGSHFIQEDSPDEIGDCVARLAAGYLLTLGAYAVPRCCEDCGACSCALQISPATMMPRPMALLARTGSLSTWWMSRSDTNGARKMSWPSNAARLVLRSASCQNRKASPISARPVQLA